MPVVFVRGSLPTTCAMVGFEIRIMCQGRFAVADAAEDEAHAEGAADAVRVASDEALRAARAARRQEQDCDESTWLQGLLHDVGD
eukprot:6037534-Amphidinium_carterae.1